jgi:TRAP-type C4-dicarboxylate transport system substrate-binding protein
MKMKRRKWVTKGFVFGMVLFVAALFQLGTSEAAPATKVITLSYNHFQPAEGWFNKIVMDFAAEIEKRTNGQVKITIFPGGVLTKADQIYDGVVKGISDIGSSGAHYSPGRFPLMSVTELPYGATSCWQGSHVIWDLYKKFRPKEYDDTHLLYLYSTSTAQFHTTKPVNKLEDFKGLKIRCAPGAAALVEALGAISVSMPMDEAFMALQRGTVEGILTSLEALKEFKLVDVTKYTTEAHAYVGPFFVTMNLDKWNSLSPEVKEIFTDVSEKYVDITGRKWDENELIGRNYALSVGHKIITLPPEELRRWNERTRPLLDKWVIEKEAKGLPARAALEEVFKLKEKYK